MFARTPGYVLPLHVHSCFSFLDGGSSVEALVERARACGYKALALTDTNGLYGAVRFHKAATAAGLRPIIGAELWIADCGLRIADCSEQDLTEYEGLDLEEEDAFTPS